MARPARTIPLPGRPEPEPRRRRPRYRLRYPGRLLAVVCLLAAMAGAAYWGARWLPALRHGEAPGDTAPVPFRDPFWILMLGVDERPGDSGRADAILLARLDPGGALHLLSLPRDTRAEIPGRGVDRLSAAYAYGGATLTLDTVSRLVGLDVRHYVKANFEGFRWAVDQLGGVTVNVDRPMYYRDPRQDLLIDLSPGAQTLTGEQALQFVRFRLSADQRHDDELARTERQQQLLQALAAQVMTPENWPRALKVLDQAGRYVSTNLNPADHARLAAALYSARQRITAARAPGQTAEIGGATYYLVDRAELGLALEALAGPPAPGN